MTLDEFQAALQITEDISQQIYRAFGPIRRERLVRTLGKLKELVGHDGMPYLQVNIGVLDRKRNDTIVFNWIDVSYCDDQKLFVLGHDTTPRVFRLDGAQVAVPEDRCPKCLGAWVIRPREHNPCPKCGLELGKDVWIVAKDVCPFCQDPRSSQTSTTCTCGFEWNAPFVTQV